jgi:hypothetical protein
MSLQAASEFIVRLSTDRSYCVDPFRFHEGRDHLSEEQAALFSSVPARRDRRVIDEDFAEVGLLDRAATGAPEDVLHLLHVAEHLAMLGIEAMSAICGSGPVPVWLRLLRGMKLYGSEYPLASADSTDVARNHHLSRSYAAGMTTAAMPVSTGRVAHPGISSGVRPAGCGSQPAHGRALRAPVGRLRLPHPAGARARRYKMELRCPDCLSPEVGPRVDDGPDDLRCDNCGERFERDEAFMTVRDAESRVPAPVPAELFVLDLALARAELEDPDGAVQVADPHSDADELDRLLDGAQDREIIRSRRAPAMMHIYPLSVSHADPLLAVAPGTGPTLLGSEQRLRRRDGEDPIGFTLRVLEEMVEEANSLAAGRAADGERLDRIAAFLGRPGQWNGGDVCEFVAEEIVASGRSLPDARE